MRLSVTTKIFLGLAAVVLTFGGVSLYSVVRLHAIGQKLEVISQTYLPLTATTAELASAHKNRARDTARLIEDDQPKGVQAVIIKIARSQYPKNMQKVAFARDRARDGLSLSPDSTDARFLARIDNRLGDLEVLYADYDRASNRLYNLLLDDAASGATIAPVLAELRKADRRLSAELSALGTALEDKVRDEVRRTEAQEDRAALVIMALSLASILVGLLVTLFVQRTLRPIRRLTRAVEQVRGGNYTSRVQVTGTDEVADLGREFNAMAQALIDRENELQGQRDALLRAERLAAVGRMAAQVSHEIRNPLSSVGLNAELLLDELDAAHFDDPARAAETRALLDAIAREVDRLTEITEEYLRFARMPRAVVVADDLAEVVEGVLSFVEGELTAAGVTLVRDLDPDVPPVPVDASQLRQALLNLVRNAREAMAGGGTLSVSLEADPESVRISVSDTGPGLPEGDPERIFEAFYSTKEGGTGLGLALTQQIMSEHGGAIRVETTPGKGTTFHLELPRTGPTGGVGEAAPPRDDGVDPADPDEPAHDAA